MKVQSSVRARLCGVAFLMALAAGCGGGGGGGEPGPGAPAAPPAGPPVGPPAVPEVRGWSKPFGSASVVLGQSVFDGFDPEGGAGTPIYFPQGRPAVTSEGHLLVTESGNYALVFGNYEAMNGPVADGRFEIRDRIGVYDLSTSGAKLIVASAFTVSILNSAPTGGVADPDVFAGDGSSGCSASQLEEVTAAALTPDGRRLIVADTDNHRVLIWNDVDQATGALGAADVVLGQEGMNTCEANADGSPDSGTLSQPRSVWSDGLRLIVSDAGNNRLLVWNDITNITDFQAPDVVIGQQDDSEAEPNRGQGAPSGISLSGPRGVDVSALGELAVADTGNNRVLIWRAIPNTADKQADLVVGQSDFTHGAANDPGQTGQHGTTLSAKTLSMPEGVRFHGRNLIVNDHGNHRVLVWRESD